METLWHDLRYGVRMLRKNPGFTLVAVMSLALGIGANTAIFSVVNGLLLRPISAERPDELVRVYTGISHASYPTYRDFIEQSVDRDAVLSGLAAQALTSFNLNRGDSAERVMGEMVSGNFFTVLGVPAAAGRTFGAEVDAEPGAHAVAVLSHSTWQRRFGADPQFVGKDLTLNGRTFTVIGVMPVGFRGTYPFGLTPELWVPATMRDHIMPGRNALADRSMHWLQLFGRRQAGASDPQARAAITAIAQRLAEAYPKENPRMELTEVYPMTGLASFRGMSFAPVIFIFLGLLSVVVGLVLLIACSNVANLQLARAHSRQKEVAIRTALGAGRGRVLRQMLTESTLLSLAGGAVGCLAAVWLMGVVSALRPPVPVPLEFQFDVDLRVLAFTAAVSMITGVLFGLAPALHATRAAIVPLLKDATGSQGRSPLRWGFRNLLVSAQVAACLMLLVTAGLFVRSLQNAQTVNPGFDVNRLATISLDLESNGYSEERGRLFYSQLVDEVERLPGVQSAAVVRNIALTFSRTDDAISPTGEEKPDRSSLIQTSMNTVGPRYFETMGIPLVAGRGFTAQDNDGAPLVGVVNETLSRRLAPGGNALGQRFRLFDGLGWGPWVEVVGIARDVKYHSIGEETPAFLYLAFPQPYRHAMTVHVRVLGEPAQFRETLRQAVLSLDHTLAVDVSTMRDNVAVAFLPARIASSALGLFGVLGLMLAAVGLYGVVNYAVTCRTHEIGVRLALGAQPGDIFRLILGQGLRLTLAGIVVGCAGALSLTRLVGSLLVGVSPADPLTFGAIGVLLMSVALVASYLPARRATRVTPMRALR